jgi:hypothetical protein
VSLIRSAVPDGENSWIKKSASVSQLWLSSLSLLKTLENTFMPSDPPADEAEPSPEERKQWARRYSKALAMLRESGIETVADDEKGANAYIEQRKCWNGHIVKIASYVAWRMEEIDCATPASLTAIPDRG